MYDYYVILDFEATCDQRAFPSPQEIIEFPAVIIDAKTNTVISEIQIYVKPKHHPKLTTFCTELTGITQEMVNKGVDIKTAIKTFNKWLTQNGLIWSLTKFVIVTCGNWDLQIMYQKQCKTEYINVDSHFKRWINIKDEFKNFYRKYPDGLKGMMTYLKLRWIGRHHSGLDDSKNIGQIWRRMISDGYKPTKKSVHTL